MLLVAASMGAVAAWGKTIDGDIAATAENFGGNTNMARFYAGVCKIDEGEATGKKDAYEDAMTLLNIARTSSMRNSGKYLDAVYMGAEILDDSALAEPEGKVVYTREYAKSKVDMLPFVNKGLSRGMTSELRLRHFGIKPGGKIVFKDDVRGLCQLLVVAAPGDDIEVMVSHTPEAAPADVIAADRGKAIYEEWTEADQPTGVYYTVVNHGNDIASVSIGAN